MNIEDKKRKISYKWKFPKEEVKKRFTLAKKYKYGKEGRKMLADSIKEKTSEEKLENARETYFQETGSYR